MSRHNRNLLLRNDAEAFFHGVIGTFSIDGGIEPVRVTDAQMAHLAERSAWQIRARCTAGVTVELRTNSPSVVLRGRIVAAARSYGGFDLEVDGCVRGSFCQEAMANPVEVHFDTGIVDDRLHEVRIHLPNVTAIRVSDIEIAENALAEPVPPRDALLLCLGDSITQGMCAVHPIETYAVQTARFLGMDLLNQGIGGHVFDAESIPERLPRMPSLVTVAYGANDWFGNCSVSEVVFRVSGYLRGLRARLPSGIPLVLISPIWGETAAERKAGGTLDQFGEAIRAAAGNAGVATVVNGFELTPHEGDYFADGVHPNESGFMHYTLGLIREAKLWRYQSGKDSG